MLFKAKDRRGEAQNVLRQCQLVQLYLLEILDEICKKHGLKYYLDFGTLLGALRHNGAIPWDDDLDVSMPEDDYERFLSVAPRELPESILLQTPRTNGGGFTSISRLRDRKSFYLEPWGCPLAATGIFVDIYPQKRKRRLPSALGERLFQLRRLAFSSEVGNRIAQSYTVRQVWRHAIMATAWHLIDCAVIALERVVSVGRGRCWTLSPGPASKLRQFNDDDIFPLGTHRYESGEFPIPHRPERLLEMYYGNWRELPPEEDRNPYAKMKLIMPTRAPKA